MSLETKIVGTVDKLGDRFWSKVLITPGCWLWQGAISKDGYASYRLNTSKTVYGHRVFFGDTDMLVDHKYVSHGCPRHCVNPDHLRLVTPKQNAENRKGSHKVSNTGVRGVCWVAKLGKYRVDVCHNNKRYYGGVFDDLDKAKQAAIDLRRKLFTHNDEEFK